MYFYTIIIVAIVAIIVKYAKCVFDKDESFASYPKSLYGPQYFNFYVPYWSHDYKLSNYPLTYYPFFRRYSPPQYWTYQTVL